MPEQPETRKLSALIREGAKLHPQGFGAYRTWDKGVLESTCVVGAAMEAAHLSVSTWGYTPTSRDLNKVLGWKRSSDVPIIPYPNGEFSPSRIYSVIIYLNDMCGWSREAIADYLASKGL